MKRLFISLITLMVIVSCTESLRDSYSGYIYIGEIPVINAKVTELNTENYTYTDNKGYFELKRMDKKSVNNLVLNNEIQKRIDTIELMRGAGAGSNIYYLFLNKRIDTLDLQRERLFKFQSNGY